MTHPFPPLKSQAEIDAELRAAMRHTWPVRLMARVLIFVAALALVAIVADLQLYHMGPGYPTLSNDPGEGWTFFGGP